MKKDWKELKSGEVFRVPKPLSDFRKFVLYCDSNQYFTVNSEREIYNYSPGVPNMGYLLTYAPGHERCKSLMKQEVEVFDEKSLPIEALAGMARGRVNSMTGSDPEIFVVRGEKRETLLPAFKFLNNQETQKKAHHSDVPLAYAYCDGFPAEFFVQAIGCHGYFIDRLRMGLRLVSAAAKKFDRTARLSIRNTFPIPKVTMANASDEEIALGCTPSLNAYNDMPTLPNSSRDLTMRFAGGHVHLGMNLKMQEQAASIVKALDKLVAVPCVGLFADLDTPVRRQFYGRAGEFRLPPHGLEYRVLSNAWLADPRVSHLVLNMVRAAAKIGAGGWVDQVPLSEEETREIINTCDVKRARKFVESNLPLFNTLMGVETGRTDSNSFGAFRKIMLDGLESMFPKYQDVEENWKLGKSWENHSDNLKASWGRVCSSFAG